MQRFSLFYALERFVELNSVIQYKKKGDTCLAHLALNEAK